MTVPSGLASAVAALGTAAPGIDDAAGRVVLPVADGAAILPTLAARLAAAGLEVSALALRRPTLEEAFLALTGRLAGNAQFQHADTGGSRTAPPPPAGPARSEA